MNVPASADPQGRQTRARVRTLFARYACGRNMRMTMWDALQQLRLIESECPTRGLALAQSFQENGHHDDDGWAALALIHNLGKIMFLFGCDADGTSAEAPWAVLGDTYVTADQPSVASSDSPDEERDWTSGVGLANVTCSFGRNEYLYQALKRNYTKHKLPLECVNIARVQSLHAWYAGDAYANLEDDRDRALKPKVQEFCAARDRCEKISSECHPSWDDPKWRDLVERMFGTEPWDF